MATYVPRVMGKVEGGEFVPNDHGEWSDEQRRLDGLEVEVTIRKRRKPRTQGAPGEASNQLGYYWGVLIRTIADEIGEMDQELVHRWVLRAVGHFKVMPDGMKIPAPTSDMDAGPFQELCKRIQIWAAQPGNVCDSGLYLPDPHEVVEER